MAADAKALDLAGKRVTVLGLGKSGVAAARLCEAAQIRHRLGAAVGSRLLAAQALHLACALPGVDYACELGEFSRMFNDPFAGIEVVNGELAVPNGPGCGVEPVAQAYGRKAGTA